MRIVLCDDDAKICEQYTKILRTIIAENKISPVVFETYSSGVELLANWQWRNNDILLLDINMPGKDGVKVAHKLREQGYQGEIIFLTVSKKYAIKAFEVDAFHYLVKDEVNQSKVATVFLDAYSNATEKERKYITLSCGGDLRNIAVDSIYYFEMQNRIMTVHYQEGEEFSFYSTMERIGEMLKEEGFVRVHRSYLVATAKSRQSAHGKEICMSNGDIIPLGTRYLSKYIEALTA